jgi:hypothetical protein
MSLHVTVNDRLTPREFLLVAFDKCRRDRARCRPEQAQFRPLASQLASEKRLDSTDQRAGRTQLTPR